MVDKKVSIGIEYQEIGAEVVRKVQSNIKNLTTSIKDLGKLGSDFDALSSSTKKLASAGLDLFNNQIKSIAISASKLKMEEFFPVSVIKNFAQEAVNAGVSINEVVKAFPSLQKAKPEWVAQQKAIQEYNSELNKLNQRYYDLQARSNLTTKELEKLGQSAVKAGVSISTITKEYPTMEIKMPNWVGEMKALEKYNKTLSDLNSRYYEMQGQSVLSAKQLKKLGEAAVAAGVSINDITKAFPALQKVQPYWVAQQRVVQEYANKIDNLNQRYYDLQAKSSMTKKELKELGEAAMRAGVSISSIAKEYPSMEVKMPNWLGEMKSIEKYNNTLSDLNSKYYEMQGQTKLSAEQLRKLGEAAVAAGVSIDTITKEFPEMDIKIPEFTTSQRAIEMYRSQLSSAAQSCATLAAAHNLPLEKVKELGDAAINQGASFQKVVSIMPQYITALRTLGTDQQKLNVVIAESSPLLSGPINAISAFSGKTGDSVVRLGWFQNALVKVSMGLDPLKKGFNSVSESMSSLWTRVNKGITSLTRFSLVIFTLRELFGRLVREVINLINEFAEFDKYISSAAAASMEYGETFDDLHEKFLDMALSIAGMGEAAFAPKDIANALNELAKAGVDVSNVTDSQLVPLLNLAQANFASLSDTVNISSAIMAGFQFDMTDTARIADVLTKAAFESRLSFEEFGKGFMEVGAMAKVANVSLEEVASAMVITTNAGWAASEAATSFLRMTEELINRTSGGAELFESVGISIIDLQNGTVTLADTFQRLIDAGVTENQVLDAFNQRSQKMALAIYQNIDQFKELTKSMEESSGFADEMAEKMLSTFSGLTQTIKYQFSAIIDTFLAAFAPATAEIMTYFSNEVLPTIFEATEELKSSFKELDFSDLEGTLASLGRSVVDIIEQLAKSPESFNNIIMMIGNFAQVGAVFLEGLIKIFDKLTPYLDELTSLLAGLATMWIVNKVNLAGFVVQIWNGVKGISSLVVTGVKGLIELVKSTKTLKSVIVATGNAAKSAEAAATMGLSLVIATLVELILNWDELNEKFDSFTVKFHDFMTVLSVISPMDFQRKLFGSISDWVKTTESYERGSLKRSKDYWDQQLKNVNDFLATMSEKQKERLKPIELTLQFGALDEESRQFFEDMKDSAGVINDKFKGVPIMLKNAVEEAKGMVSTYDIVIKQMEETEGISQDELEATKQIRDLYADTASLEDELNQLEIDHQKRLDEIRTSEMSDQDKLTAITKENLNFQKESEKIGERIQTNGEKINELSKEHNIQLKDSTKSASEYAQQLSEINDYIEKIPEAFNTVTEATKQMIDWIGRLSIPELDLSSMDEQFNRALKTIQQYGDFLNQFVSKLQTDVWQKAFSVIYEGLFNIADTLTDLGSSAQDVEDANKVIEDFQKTIENLLSLFELFNKLLLSSYPTINEISSGFNRFSLEVKNLETYLASPDFKNNLESIRASIDNIVKSIGTFEVNVKHTIPTIESFNNIIENVLSLFETFTKIMESPIITISNLERGFSNLTKSLLYIEEFFSGDFWKSLSDSMVSAIKNISDSFTNLIPELTKQSAVIENMNSIFGTLLSFMENITKVTEISRISIADMIKGFAILTSNIKTFTTLIPNYMQNISDSFESLSKSDFGEWMEENGKYITDFINDINEFISSLLTLSENLGKIQDLGFGTAITGVISLEYAIKSLGLAFSLRGEEIKTALSDLETAILPISDMWVKISTPLQEMNNMFAEIESTFTNVAKSLGKTTLSIYGIIAAIESLKRHSGDINDIIKSLKGEEIEPTSELFSLPNIKNPVSELISKSTNIISGQLSNIVSPILSATGGLISDYIMGIAADIGGTIFKQISSSVGSFIDSLSKLATLPLDIFTNIINSFQKGIELFVTILLSPIDILTNVINKLTEGIISLINLPIELISKNLETFNEKIVGLFTLPIDLLSKNITTFNDKLMSLATLPIDLIVNGVNKINESIISFLTLPLDLIVNSVNTISEKFLSLVTLPIDTFTKGIQDLTNKFIDLAFAPFDTLKNNIDTINEKFMSLAFLPIDLITKSFDAFMNKMVEVATIPFTIVTDSITKLSDSLISFITLPFDQVSGAIQKYMDGLIEFLTLPYTTFSNMFSDLTDAITNFLLLPFNQFENIVSNLVGSFTDLLTLPLTSLSSIIENLYNNVSEIINIPFKAFSSLVNSVLDSFNKIISLPFDSLNTVISNLIDKISSFLTLPLDSFIKLVGDSTEKLSSLVTLPIDTFLNVSNKIVETLSTLLNIPINTFAEIINSLVSKYIDMMSIPLNFLTDLFSSLTEQLITIITLPLDSIINTLNSFAAFLVNILDEVTKSLTNILTIPFSVITNVLDTLNQVITDLITMIPNTITEIFDEITNVIITPITIFKNTVSSLQDVFTELLSLPFTTFISSVNSISKSFNELATIPFTILTDSITTISEEFNKLSTLPITLLITSLTNIMDTITRLVLLPVTELINIISLLSDTINTLIVSPLTSIITLIESVSEAFNTFIALPFTTLSTAIKDLTSSFVELVSAPIKEITEIVKDVFNTLSSIFTEPFKNIIDTISKIANTIEDIILPPLEEFASVINNIINPLGGLGKSLGTIKSFDNGGYVERDMIGLLHSGEYVIPRENNNKVYNIYVNNNNTISNNADIRKIADVILRELERTSRY